MEITNSDEDDYNKYHSIPPHEYPLFQNYQLVGDSQLVRFAELFLNSKRLYFQNSSGRVGYCISGQNAKQLSRHLEHKPWPVYQNVILLIGTNDISLNTDPSQWKESLKRIVTLFKQYNVKNLFMLTVPPVPKLWHTVQHWTLFVQYNEILKDLETKYRGFFSTLQLVDITSIFFVKSSLSTSFYCARLDLYVACPALQEEEDYDQHFMMSVKSRTRKVAEEVKDNSYLKQSISLFDTMNMRYKLMACFKGQTNDEDVSSINKNRFDLIEVTLNDVCNIKNNLLAINNEGYLYTLRHAFQKFLSHINQDRYVGKRESYVWSVRELADDAFVPSKMSRSELYGATSDDLETSGVLCRSLDSSGQSKVSMTETPVAPSTACVRKPPSSPGAAANTLLINIKQEICLKKSPDSTLSSGMKRRGSKENVWIELRDKPDKDPATPHVTKARRGDHSPKNVFFNSNSRSISVRFDSNESTSRQAVIDTITPTQVALAQKRTLAAATVTSVPPPSDPSPGNTNIPGPGRKRRERSFRDVLGFIQKTLHDLKVDSDPPAAGIKPETVTVESACKGIESKCCERKDKRRPLRVTNSNCQIPVADGSMVNSRTKSSSTEDLFECESRENSVDKSHVSNSLENQKSEKTIVGSELKRFDIAIDCGVKQQNNRESPELQLGHVTQAALHREVDSVVPNNQRRVSLVHKPTIKNLRENPSVRYVENNLRATPNRNENHVPTNLSLQFSRENQKSNVSPSPLNVCSNNSNRDVSLHYPEVNPKCDEHIQKNLYPSVGRTPSLCYISNNLCSNDVRRTNINSNEQNASSIEFRRPNDSYVNNSLYLGESNENPSCPIEFRRPNDSYANNDMYPRESNENNPILTDLRRPYHNYTNDSLFPKELDENNPSPIMFSTLNDFYFNSNLYPGEFKENISSPIENSYPCEILNPSNRFVTENEGSLNILIGENTPCPTAVRIPNARTVVSIGPSEAINCVSKNRSPSICYVANNLRLPYSSNDQIPAVQHDPKAPLNRDIEVCDQWPPDPKDSRLPDLIDSLHPDICLSSDLPGCYYRRDYSSADSTHGNTHRRAQNNEMYNNSNNNYASTLNFDKHCEGPENAVYHSEMTTDNFPLSTKYSSYESESSDSKVYEFARTFPSPTSPANNITPLCPIPDSRVLTNYDDLNSRWTSKRSCERERAETVGLGTESAHLVGEKSKYPAGNVALKDDATHSSDGKQQHSSKKIDYYNAQSTRNFEETDVLNIEYLTSEEKQDLENRLSRKAMKQKSRHDTFTRKSGGNSRYQKWIGGYDQAFMERTNTIQFYQFVQAVCKYQTNHDVRPLEERTFYMHVRNMKSSEVSDLESKFYSSMLGRYEFYKFIKYISLDYIVPKMFPNKFKKVMFTSLIDKNSNLEKYVPRNLDISVFETHFSRPTNYPRNKKLRVDLVHLNQKGFELMKHSLCEAISQTEQGGAEPLNQ